MTSGTSTCTANYDQAGNDNYAAAAQVIEYTTARKAATTITAANASATLQQGQSDNRIDGHGSGLHGQRRNRDLYRKAEHDRYPLCGDLRNRDGW
jgi:hypothetical protein